MKKSIIAFLVAICYIISFSSFVFAAQGDLGDVDSDGKITASDARLVLRASVGLEKFSIKQIISADTDGNPGITASDARLILRASVGLESLTEQNTPEQEEKPSSTIVEEFTEAFKKEAKKYGATTNKIATALSKNELVQFAPFVQDMPAGYLPGFDKDIAGFKACTSFSPMIGTIPFVSYVFELEAYTDPDSFIDYLKGNANLRWNICTAADEMMVTKEGRFIFFIMSPLSFPQE